MLNQIIKMLDLSKYVVRHDAFDEYVFSDVRQYEGLRSLDLDLPTVEELIFDTFKLFYKIDPKFLDDGSIHPMYRLNKTILQRAVNTEEYDRLREITKLDEMNSAVATVSFVRTVISEILKDPEIRRKMSGIENTINDMINTAKQLSDLQSKLNQTKDRKWQNKIKKQIDQLQNKLNQLNDMLDVQTQSISSSVTQIAVSKAVMTASNAAREFREAESALSISYGLVGGQITKVPADARIRLANLLLKNRKLRYLAKILGRVKNIRTSTRKSRIRRPVSEIYDVMIGSDISRAIPAELTKLNIPELKMDFLKRFAEGQLMIYRLKDKDKTGKGAFIVCIDTSGSMKGEKELWAKAVALAIAEMAIKQKRPFAVIMFDAPKSDRGAVHFHKVFTKPPAIEDIIEIAETFTGGGTNFEEPLSFAMNAINAKGWAKSDILFITDGESKVST
ncbi:hypothetical protein DRO54_06230, partial [Candidatus Bathyarchaeota archaeon]